MKKALAWITVGIALVACGGGGSGGNEDTTAPEPPTPPPPAQAPSVKVLSGSIIRYAAKNTGLSINIAAQPSFKPAGTLYAMASDNASIMQAPVLVTANTDGSYNLAVDTLASMAPGHYTGDLTLKLCSDAACATPQPVPSITVPYDITVMAAGNAWPGDHLTALVPWTDVPDWTTFQGNAAHTGYVPVELKPDQFSLRWKTGPISNDTESYFGYSATLAASKGLFYGASGKLLKARKEFDGSIVWTYDFSTLTDPSVNPPAVADGVVYMTTHRYGSSFMFGFDAASGTVRFKTPMSGEGLNHLAPTPFNGAVYTNAGSYGGIYGFTSSGENLFVDTFSSGTMWTPAVDATSVYAYVGASLTMFDPRTGAQLGSIKDSASDYYGYEVNGAAVIASPGTVFAANYSMAGYSSGNALLKFNTAKGFIDWRIEGAYPVTPAYAGGVVYAPNKAPYRVEARAEADGALQWSWTPQVAGETAWGELVLTKNLLFVSTNMATYAVDLRTHKAVWSYPAAGKLALTQSGILYIQNSDALVAINVK